MSAYRDMPRVEAPRATWWALETARACREQVEVDFPTVDFGLEPVSLEELRARAEELDLLRLWVSTLAWAIFFIVAPLTVSVIHGWLP